MRTDDRRYDSESVQKILFDGFDLYFALNKNVQYSYSWSTPILLIQSRRRIAKESIPRYLSSVALVAQTICTYQILQVICPLWRWWTTSLTKHRSTGYFASSRQEESIVTASARGSPFLIITRPSIVPTVKEDVISRLTRHT